MRRAPAVGRGQRTLLALGCVALTACYSGGGGSLRPTATIYSGGGVSGLTPASQWVEVRLPVARASVRMPSQPQYLPASTGVEDDGAAYRTTIGGRDYGSVQLMVAISEVDGGIVGQPLERLHAMRESLLEDAQEQAFGTVMVNGSPGFDIAYIVTESGQLVNARAVLGRRHIYLLMAMMAPHLAASHRATTAAYLESLRLDPQDSFGATGDGVYRAGAWRWSMPAEAHFAVRFPGAPTAAEATSPAEGARFVRTYRVIGAGGATFEVRATGYEDLRPPGAVATLEAAPLAHYSLRVARDTTRQGYSGRSLVYESEGRMRFTLIFGTYGATYEVSVDLPRTASPDMIEARNIFLDSFRML
ncbi:MAG: hypothetical protein IPG17_01565 [Sandaracinaceae bacterium]|nr:hypothetical protein [Sandaracinaceae bacterium]MBK6813374.1 hypothetical protein [Sandaracinaceae bacterium]MBK7153041.1 hypothetical protein [Sandaracinaceae bacterium]MBK8411177.1 hypothetical protein [Sandaracinaceae bacterium]